MYFILLLLVWFGCSCPTAGQWNEFDSVRWKENCDFFGNDLVQFHISPDQCGKLCKTVSQCSHFTMNKNTGWCYLKQGSVTEGKDWSYQNAICGYIKGRNGKEVDLRWNDSGAVRWAMNCVLNGNDFVQFPSTVERCGPVCVLHGACTHFTWGHLGGGTCYLKRGKVSEESATHSNGSVCGYIKNRMEVGGNIDGRRNVKGTYWKEQSDRGSCQMPKDDYVVTDAIALGQSNALGNLKWRHGLCGQVLQIDCGKGSVEAVVAGICNVSTDSCGISMIEKTWNQTTQLDKSDIASCNVALTNKNPIRGNTPVCRHRPTTANTSYRYRAFLGVFNTGGKICSSAVAARLTGTRTANDWFEFNAGSRPLLVNSAQVIFRFEDGTESTFKLEDCRPGGRTFHKF